MIIIVMIILVSMTVVIISMTLLILIMVIVLVMIVTLTYRIMEDCRDADGHDLVTDVTSFLRFCPTGNLRSKH